MFNCILILASALIMGETFRATGILFRVAAPLKRFIRSGFSLIMASFFLGLLLTIATGSGQVGAIIALNSFHVLFEEHHVDKAIFTEAVCAYTTLTQPLVPWGSSGAFVSQCFGLSPLTYAPYYFLGYTLPLFFVVMLLLEGKPSRLYTRQLQP